VRASFDSKHQEYSKIKKKCFVTRKHEDWMVKGEENRPPQRNNNKSFEASLELISGKVVNRQRFTEQPPTAKYPEKRAEERVDRQELSGTVQKL
jgi:hypothetical protein